MAAINYKIVTIENYDDDAATEAALNVDGADGWELVEINYVPKKNGKSTATVLYKKEVL